MRKTYAFALLCALFCLNFTSDLTKRRPLVGLLESTKGLLVGMIPSGKT